MVNHSPTAPHQSVCRRVPTPHTPTTQSTNQPLNQPTTQPTNQPTDRPYLAVWHALEDLGRHVAGGPALRGEAVGRRDLLREAEVGQLDVGVVAVVLQQQVLRLGGLRGEVCVLVELGRR